MFRQYYNLWDLPVIDMSDRLYCCGQCQNRDAETHECGQMLVGSCCIDKHPNAYQIKKSNNYDSE